MFDLTLKAIRVYVMLTTSTDKVCITFEGKSPYPNWLPEEKPTFQMDVSANTGERFINENFPGVPYDIINTR